RRAKSRCCAGWWKGWVTRKSPGGWKSPRTPYARTSAKSMPRSRSIAYRRPSPSHCATASSERRAFALATEEMVNPESLHYLNRLSDLLFVLCRVLTRAGAGEEILWESARLKQSSKSKADL